MVYGVTFKDVVLALIPGSASETSILAESAIRPKRKKAWAPDGQTMVKVSEVPELMKGLPGLSSETFDAEYEEFSDPVPAVVEVILVCCINSIRIFPEG